MRADWDVVVIGAGLAGLAAGATATRAGSATLVLDAHRPGGRARITKRDGFLFNRGLHALYRGGAGWEVLRGLGIEPQGSPPPFDRYRALAAGELHLLPMSLDSLRRTTLLGPADKETVAAFLMRLAGLRSDRLAGTSVADWVAGSGLGPAAAAVITALIRLTTYASDPDTFAADAAAAQLQAGAGGVVYLDGGWAQLIDRLATRCQVRTGTKVSGVAPAAGRLEVSTNDGRLRARSVIIATGRPAAARRLLPADPGWGWPTGCSAPSPTPTTWRRTPGCAGRQRAASTSQTRRPGWLPPLPGCASTGFARRPGPARPTRARGCLSRS